jgi:hypothetical protein
MVMTVFTVCMTGCGNGKGQDPEAVRQETRKHADIIWDGEYKGDLKISCIHCRGHRYLMFTFGDYENAQFKVVHDPDCPKCMGRDTRHK